MQGYERTGPVGAGPHWGEGLSDRGGASDGTGFPANPCRNQGSWRKGRDGGGGRRFRRRRGGLRGGFRIRSRAAEDAGRSDVTPRRRQAFLRRRIRELTEQLDRLNQLLSDDPPGGVRDQE
jgi:hypothetical protein